MLNTRTSTYQSQINFFVKPLQNQESPSKKCANAYTFGFNGQEMDNEVKGSGNSYDFGARIHDPRLGRFLSLDQFADKQPNQSNYSFAGNSPIVFIDANGHYKMPKALQEQYPQLTNLLKNIQQTIHNDPKAFAAFRDNLGLTDKQANRILEWGKGPVVDVQALTNAYAATPVELIPNAGRVIFDKDLVNALEGKNPNNYTKTSNGLIMLLYATAGHEGQHAAQNMTKGIAQVFYPEHPSYDNGHFYEAAAFGEVVGEDNADKIAENYPNLATDLNVTIPDRSIPSEGNYGGSGMGMTEKDPIE